MRTSYSTILGSFLLITVCCAPSYVNLSSEVDQPQVYSLPQDSHCAIVGKVTELETNEPVIGSSIITVGDRHGTVADRSGNFSMPNLRPGPYRIRVSSIGHYPAESVKFVLKVDELAVLKIRLLRKEAILSH